MGNLFTEKECPIDTTIHYETAAEEAIQLIT